MLKFQKEIIQSPVQPITPTKRKYIYKIDSKSPIIKHIEHIIINKHGDNKHGDNKHGDNKPDVIVYGINGIRLPELILDST